MQKGKKILSMKVYIRAFFNSKNQEGSYSANGEILSLWLLMEIHHQESVSAFLQISEMTPTWWGRNRDTKSGSQQMPLHLKSLTNSPPPTQSAHASWSPALSTVSPLALWHSCPLPASWGEELLIPDEALASVLPNLHAHYYYNLPQSKQVLFIPLLVPSLDTCLSVFTQAIPLPTARHLLLHLLRAELNCSDKWWIAGNFHELQQSLCE